VQFKFRLLIVGLLATLFFAGIVQLFLLRFKAGDIYPPYSSLRSDPLGTKVFYASLERFDRLRIQRNYSRLSALPSGNGATLFFLGTELGQLLHAPDSFFKDMERWVATGGRLVFSLRAPQERKNKKGSSQDSESQKPGSSPLEDKRTTITEDTDSESDSSNPSDTPRLSNPQNSSDTQKTKSGYTPLREHWGVTIGSVPTDSAANNGVSAVPSAGLPFDNVKWHGWLNVLFMTSNWQPIMSVGGKPVMIERRLRGGSIVLATDSYFMSNEALSLDRQPSLLTWLIEGRSKIVFDERHLGVVQSPGLAKLVRRYGFQWFAAGALLLMALFIWKNARPFIPPAPQKDPDQSFDYASEKDSYQGLISLLRRNIPSRRILPVCIAEWQKTNETNRMIPESNIKAVDAFLQKWENSSGADQDPVDAYRRLSKILMEGKKTNAS